MSPDVADVMRGCIVAWLPAGPKGPPLVFRRGMVTQGGMYE